MNRQLLRALWTAAAVAATVSLSATASPAPDPLLEAIRSGNPRLLLAMLQREPELAARRLPDGTTPLMQAAFMEKHELVPVLRRFAPELDFFEACIVGEVALVRAALAKGQSTGALSPGGFPALGLAVFFRHEAVARLLLDAGADVNQRSQNTLRVAPLHAAVARGDLGLLQLLLLRGADPNLAQLRWLRPVHEAAASGNLAIVATLLMFDADPALRAEDGRSPADFARAGGHADLAARLERLAQARR